MRMAFDSHVISYFLNANQAGYDPHSDPDADLAEQRVAAFRLFVEAGLIRVRYEPRLPL
jgi:hypothetical protein